MKDKILNLRAEGKSYNEIVDILKCAKSTVSYYCKLILENKGYKVSQI